jgi:hypothetical protein
MVATLTNSCFLNREKKTMVLHKEAPHDPGFPSGGRLNRRVPFRLGVHQLPEVHRDVRTTISNADLEEDGVDV